MNELERAKEIKGLLRCLRVPRLEFDDNSGNWSDDPFILYQEVQISKGKLLDYISEVIASALTSAYERGLERGAVICEGKIDVTFGDGTEGQFNYGNGDDMAKAIRSEIRGSKP